MNNIYFLVEGKTEKIIYSQWLKFLLPQFSEINQAEQAVKNHYYIFSGMGYPQIINHLAYAVADINEWGNYRHLILVIDTDDETTQVKKEKINQLMSERLIVPESFYDFHIITQTVCIETWFLGNGELFFDTENGNHDFYSYIQHYDVSQKDPELMIKPNEFKRSTSIYHETYLRRMLAQKNISYSKSNPKEVGKEYYLTELKKRITESSHLVSLKHFFDFCELITAKN